MPYLHEAKLKRSLEHLHAMERVYTPWREQNPYPLASEKDPEKPGYIVRYMPTIDFPAERFAVLTGDFLHNLRAALDHLIYELALKWRGATLSEKERERCEFPVFGTRSMTDQERERKIGCIDPRAQALIKAMQPSERGDRYSTEPLWALHELERIDKHRLVHIVSTGVSLHVAGRNATVLEVRLDPNLRDLARGAEIGRVSAVRTDPKRAMHMDLQFVGEIHLAEGTPTSEFAAYETMRALFGKIIVEVVLPLRPFL